MIVSWPDPPVIVTVHVAPVASNRLLNVEAVAVTLYLFVGEIERHHARRARDRGRVDTSSSEDGIQVVKVQRVIRIATVQNVGAQTSSQLVITSATCERVIASTTGEIVVHQATGNRVVSTASRDGHDPRRSRGIKHVVIDGRRGTDCLDQTGHQVHTNRIGRTTNDSLIDSCTPQ